MPESAKAALHGAYAASYDADVQAYDCHVAEVLFGLSFEYIRPGQRLLDVGTGTGLAGQLFAACGLQAYGMDFSPAMLELCRAKGFATDLQCHDVQDAPWPYPSSFFDHVACCGVLHLVDDLEPVFAEPSRVLVDGGGFAFTTKARPQPVARWRESLGKPRASLKSSRTRSLMCGLCLRKMCSVS